MKLINAKVLETIDSVNLRIKVTVEYEDDHKQSDYDGVYNLLRNSFEPNIDNAWLHAKVQNCVEARKGIDI